MMTTAYVSALCHALLGVSLLLASVVDATADQPLSPEFDLSQVTVEFKVKVLGVIPVTGLFREVRGSFLKSGLNRKPGFNITVCLNSVDTRDAERDRLLRSRHFFDVERFPAIRFSDVQVISTQSGVRHLVGQLTLHGVRRPVAFRIRALPAEAAGRTGNVAMYAAHTVINRSAYGLDAFPLLISDEVEITVYLDGDLTDPGNGTYSASSGDRYVSGWPAWPENIR
jgi:polyisoprenoid-binding protein YceI